MRPLRQGSRLQKNHALDPKRARRRPRHLSERRIRTRRQRSPRQLEPQRSGRRNLGSSPLSHKKLCHPERGLFFARWAQRTVAVEGPLSASLKLTQHDRLSVSIHIGNRICETSLLEQLPPYPPRTYKNLQNSSEISCICGNFS